MSFSNVEVLALVSFCEGYECAGEAANELSMTVNGLPSFGYEAIDLKLFIDS